MIGGEPVRSRDLFSLRHVEAQAAAFEEALERGRLHHAWLLTGPKGVGKAAFASHLARRLLGAKTTATPLVQDPRDPVSRMASAGSHPDLLVLERWSEAQPARKSIPVDEARRLPEFFAKAPALGAYRVAVVDAADDLNVNAANAVLKTLEEPSGRGVILLVSHAPGRLLTTIRSRCRRLAFAPWTEAALAAFAAETLEVDPAEADRLAGMAHGAPGRLVALAAGGADELDARAGALLQGGDGAERRTDALRLTDRFRGGEGAETFALFLERLGDRLHAAALQAATPAAACAWAELWRRVAELPARVEALNLDRADAFWSLLAEIRATVRREGPAPC